MENYIVLSVSLLASELMILGRTKDDAEVHRSTRRQALKYRTKFETSRPETFNLCISILISTVYNSNINSRQSFLLLTLTSICCSLEDSHFYWDRMKTQSSFNYTEQQIFHSQIHSWINYRHFFIPHSIFLPSLLSPQIVFHFSNSLLLYIQVFCFL